MSFRSEAERILSNKKTAEQKVNALESAHRRYSNLHLAKAVELQNQNPHKNNTVASRILARLRRVNV